MSDREEPLESGLIADIATSKARHDEVIQFFWEYYAELAFQRNEVYDSLKSSLRERATPFEFHRWQRVVKYRYSLDPLSTKGSVVDPGGRFNIGAIDPARYPVFAALYLASDKGTALAELLGRDQMGSSFTAEELALTKPDSIAAVSVSGRLESLLDVREGKNLVGFVNLIKEFRLSGPLTSKARRLGLSPLLRLITTVGRMVEVLQARNWRIMPMRLDSPSPSQVFGRVAMDAGIEGVIYNSVLTDKPCLVVYPQNFPGSSSFVELDDPTPTPKVRTRIDATTYRGFI
jgi:RES domain